MKETHSEYRMKRFLRSTDRGFADALRVYTKSFPPSLKTNSNEIAFWLDNYSRFTDVFMIFGFYANDRVIGFSEIAFFRDEKLLVVDYIAIEESYRKNNVFMEFSEHLRLAIDSEGIDFDYVVAEVGYLSDTEQPSEYSRSLIRLLKFMGFGIVKAPYYQPQLGLTNFESKMEAVLMVSTMTLTPVRKLQAETYLSFVHAIYYKHYLRWYSMYESSALQYEALIDDLYAKVRLRTRGKESFEVNGHGDSMQASRLSTAKEIPEAGHLRAAYISIMFFAIFTAVLLGLKKFLEIPMSSLITIYLVVMLSFFAVMALFSAEAMRIFDSLLDFIKSFRRTK
jgi:hypothetical protein